MSEYYHSYDQQNHIPDYCHNHSDHDHPDQPDEKYLDMFDNIIILNLNFSPQTSCACSGQTRQTPKATQRFDI